MKMIQTSNYKISEWKEKGGRQDKIKIHNVQCTVLNMVHAQNEIVCGVTSILFLTADLQGPKLSSPCNFLV
jgi:hypothetical protein